MTFFTDPVDTTSDTIDETTGEPMKCGTLQVMYRDFKPLHEDFGCHMNGNSARPGLVMQQLGADTKPVYNPAPPPPPANWTGTDPQITSAAAFSDWYNSKPDINIEIAGELELTEIMPVLWSFSSDAFYPLTDMGFGNNFDPNWSGETIVLLRKSARTDALLPGVAPAAKQAGTYVGRLVEGHAMKKTLPDAFRYADYGNLATIGHSKAVIDFGAVRVKGLLAWLLWSVAHVYCLIGFRNRSSSPPAGRGRT